jgi:hypothetical protein
MEQTSSGYIFKVETLYDGRWCDTGVYETMEQAQDFAWMLVPDWGQQRVRIYEEYADGQPQDRIRNPVPLKKPVKKSFFKRLISSPFIQSYLMPIAMAVTVASFAYPAIAGGLESTQHVALAPIAKNNQQLFVEAVQGNYQHLQKNQKMPARLEGVWRENCAVTESGFDISGMNVRGQYTLQLVLQSRQNYGLVTDDGQVLIYELTGADRLKRKGALSSDGAFIEQKDITFNRCL